MPSGVDLRRWQIEGHRHLEPEAAVGVGDRQPRLRLRPAPLADDQSKQRDYDTTHLPAPA